MGGSPKGIRQKILAGKIGKKDVVRLLAELAFGRANDCVKLALEERPELDGLDLRLLSEVRRSEKGMVEVKLIDRLEVLEQLAKLVDGDENQLADFLQAVQGGGGA